jgi:hypothetical protein
MPFNMLWTIIKKYIFGLVSDGGVHSILHLRALIDATSLDWNVLDGWKNTWFGDGLWTVTSVGKE